MFRIITIVAGILMIFYAGFLISKIDLPRESAAPINLILFGGILIGIAIGITFACGRPVRPDKNGKLPAV